MAASKVFLPQRTQWFYAKDAKRKLLKIKSLRSLRKIFAHLAVNIALLLGQPAHHRPALVRELNNNTSKKLNHFPTDYFNLKIIIIISQPIY